MGALFWLFLPGKKGCPLCFWVRQWQHPPCHHQCWERLHLRFSCHFLFYWLRITRKKEKLYTDRIANKTRCKADLSWNVLVLCLVGTEDCWVHSILGPVPREWDIAHLRGWPLRRGKTTEGGGLGVGEPWCPLDMVLPHRYWSGAQSATKRNSRASSRWQFLCLLMSRWQGELWAFKKVHTHDLLPIG